MTRGLEFAYLRDNRLSSLSGFPQLAHLKVLDLSNNALTTLAELPILPQLKELYLAGNKITDVSTIPALPALEVLSLRGNHITSLVGMNEFPNLTALFLANNKLDSWRGFPVFPKLDSLRLLENPIARQPFYSVAAISLYFKSLSKLDGFAISPEDKHQAESLPIKFALLLRRGMPLFEASASSLDEQCDRFCVESQKDVSQASSCKLASCYVVGNAVEQQTITAKFEFNCDDHIHAEKATLASNDFSLIGGLRFCWFRATRGDSPVPIPTATKQTYTTTTGDIGCCLVAECHPVLPSGEVKTPFYVYSRDVAPEKPTVAVIELVGKAVDGGQLTVSVHYVGGAEGASEIRWFHVPPYRPDKPTQIPMELKARFIMLDTSDIGSIIMAEYTPVRSDSERGTPVSVRSEIVKPA
eukprot:TRINITY_DN7719_c0_g1_i1.p1 TRINITY_DN7719_c0_g1~~TRINITY_DN7719_c0_g1_i1.p1  ORF type:complete len:457 (+),score=103.39 TRINITY_DN7719_c0_g1_i1:134-1372(+)